MTATTSGIAILTSHLLSSRVGGIEVFNDLLRRALDNVEIFADPASGPGETMSGLQRIGLAEPYRALGTFRAFRERHREHPFRLVISNGLYGWPLFLGRIAVPKVQVYHYTPEGFARKAIPLRGDRLTTRTVTAFFDRMAGLGKHIIAVSPSVLGEVERYYGLSGRVIPNGVDTTLFRSVDQATAREDLGFPQEGTIGLFVGRTDYAKGFDVFLKVAGGMRDISFVVAGHSSTEAPNVRVLGTVPRSRMPLVYSSADFLVLPSRYEGFNLSILEALACDLPIVVSAAAYPFDEDPALYGRVTESHDPRGFVRAIRELLDQSAPAPRKEIVARYTFDTFRENWQNLVGQVLEGENT